MNPEKIRHSWPHQWYGFWWRDEDSGPELPRVESAIDLFSQPDDLVELVGYLKRAPIDLTSMSRSRCRLCKAEVPTFSFRFDGVWFWPVDLEHYVAVHSVVLPERFAVHIREQNYSPPEEETLSGNVRQLHWPESYVAIRTRYPL